MKVMATSPTLELITQPLFWLGSANQENGVLYAKVPKVMNHTYPPLMVQWYSSTTKTSDSKADLNLISIYGVKVEVTKASVKGSTREIRVDMSKAKQPEGYSFTVNEVATFTAKAIRADFKDTNSTKISIYDGKKSVEYKETKRD